MVYQLETRLCRACQRPFHKGQAIVAEVMEDDYHQPTTYDFVHARCIEEVDDVYRGVPGDMGPDGPQGPVGRTGKETTGPQGEPGRVGTQGPIGPVGSPGPRGGRGPQGPRGIPGKQGDSGGQGTRGVMGLTGRPGADGTDHTNAILTLGVEMERLRRVVGATPLAGTVVCPECSTTWDLQNDLHLGDSQRAIFRCNCKTELVVTGRGVQRRNG